MSNSGTINVNGINGIGIKITHSGSSVSEVMSSGTINVAGGVGANGLRNYGIWAEGPLSTATLTGDVNLSGVGGIGVHARAGGKVVVSGDGAVNFAEGSNQIGYFIHGAGSSITNTGTAALDVSTEKSTLYRIEDGATFSGGSSAANYTASGEGSTIFDVTGAGVA